MNFSPRFFDTEKQRLECEGIVDSVDCLFALLFFNQNRNFDFTGRNHADVDVVFAQCFEHGGGYTRVGEHTSTNNGNLGNIVVKVDLLAAYRLAEGFGDLHGSILVCSGNGKADVLGALTSDRLQDDVYVDFAGSQRGENSESDARLVRNLDDRDAGDVVVESDPFDKHFFHFANLLDNGARHIAVGCSSALPS